MKKYILPIVCLTLVFLAGIMDAGRDKMQFHYENSIFPQQEGETFLGGGPGFWNPEISWKNKYENRDPDQGDAFFGSTTFFVFLTDGWHLLQFIELTFFYLAAALPLLRLMGWSLWWAALAILPFRAVFSLGFTIFFNFVLERRK